MKTYSWNDKSRIGLLTAVLLATGVAARSADTNTLKDAYKDHFYVGVAINGRLTSGWVQNPAQPGRDAALVLQQYNQIVPENELKWESVQPREGANGYNWGAADNFVNFGLSNNMFIVGHTLVWHGQTPGWVFQETNLAARATNADAAPDNAGANAPGGRRGGRGGGRGGISGPMATREEVLQRMHDHIATVVGRYKGKIKVWDVVNEALADGGANTLRDSPWTQTVGQDFIAKAFEYAHEADPDAILRYNDYGLESAGKRRKLITLIKSLQEQHVPVMAIGTQTHVSVSGPTFAQEDQALTEIETLGLPIHITELDVTGAQGGQRGGMGDVAGAAAAAQGGLVSNADRRLAAEYSALFRAFVKHEKYVKVVTFWGVNDGVSWIRGGSPLPFDSNDQPKAAFDAIIRAATGQEWVPPTTIETN
jgi:endo-1,4-beta-xylanase